MNKNFFIFFFVSVMPAVYSAVLPEGFVLNGIEGTAKAADNNTGWDFITGIELTYMKTVLPAGSSLAILKSSGLGQVASFAKEQKSVKIKVYGILTLYKSKNYLFPIYCLPLSDTTTESETPAESAKASDPNQTDVIPADIMHILKSKSTVDLRQLSEAGDTAQRDFSLINRTGYIHHNEIMLFIPDAFGRKIQAKDYILLPCLTLETTENKLTRNFERYRFSVSGIITQYEGRQYLLLYRGVRTYSQGNLNP